jgi:hypothetical protein
MKYHFITFATDNYIKHANNICNSSKLAGFDICRIFTFNDIDHLYKERNSYILNHKQGAGFWIWKSYIILKYMSEIDKDDIVCYCDSLYLFTGETKIQDIMHLIDIKSGILITHNKPNEPTYLEKQYTKGDAFMLMNTHNEQYYNTPQAWGGFIVIKNNFISLQVISEWFTYVQDERIVTNLPSVFRPDCRDFIENRHDQTVISIVCKKYKIPLLHFPKYFLHNIRVPKV